MQALAQVHIMNHKLTATEFIRVCYYWRFNCDITGDALANDVKCFCEYGTVPPYMVSYLIHLYGAQ